MISFKFNFSLLAGFDVYNIETALPVIDLEAIENHLKAAKEEERRVSFKFQFRTLLNKFKNYQLNF